MDYELNCKWHFAEMGPNSGKEGPNDALKQTFKQFPWESLVRESIQNSLDVSADSNNPVIVSFEHRTFDREDYPNFFNLVEHIQACRNTYAGVESAEAMYPPMIDFLKRAKEIGYVRVSDYNTSGMTYDPDDVTTTFDTFVRSAGVSVKKKAGSGGSFGFGKGAFFAMSPINTLIVSTIDSNGNRYFEGVTRLCTHVIDNVKYNHVGFYDNNGGQPTSDESKIPLPFKRKSQGTSIGIMGVDSRVWNSSVDEVVRAVLGNFFASILENRLEVYVNGNPEKEGRQTIKINSSNIKEMMDKYYPSTEIGNKDYPFNPRPYFEALTDQNTEIFKETLPILGDVTLTLKEFEDNPTSIVFMRKPLMKIYEERFGKSLPYNGVFVCADEIGNAILGDIEDPSHKVWNPQIADDARVKTDFKVAKKAKVELNNFIQHSLDQLSQSKATDFVSVAELEKYLPAEGEESKKGEKGNPFSGTPTGKSVKEGANLTTEGSVLKEVATKDRNAKGTIIHIESDATTKSSGKPKEPTGTGGTRNGGTGGKVGPGNNWKDRTVIEGDGRVKRLVEVEWRPLQLKKKGMMDIVIYATKDLSDCEISFQIGRESAGTKGRPINDDVRILNCNRKDAVLDGLTIRNISLRGTGKNIIRVEFSDHMNHTLDIAVYEFD